MQKSNNNNNNFKLNLLFLGFNATAIRGNCISSTVKKGKGFNTDT
jgi:hypothetical protein